MGHLVKSRAGVSGPWTDWFWNALPTSAGGQILTADQIAAIAEERAQAIVKNSRGAITLEAARKQAATEGDTANILADYQKRDADTVGRIVKYAGIGLAAFAGIVLLKD